MADKTEYVGNVILHYSACSDMQQSKMEDMILDIVKTYKKSSYNKVIDERKEWPVLYHLSEIRENIISWIPFSKKDRILEIGAACGAITGILAEKAGKVDCVELLEKRCLINAERHRDFDNVDIYIGNIEDVDNELKLPYDYITMIGSFASAATHIHSENPYVDMLILAKKHLKKQGKIILAIENKYGLKYWAGCKEDHTGEYYKGLEGYGKEDGIQTFSKKGLTKLFEESGLKKITFYYPYPDYKFPMSIYSDNYLPKAGELIFNMRNFDYNRMVLFDEAKVFDSLIIDEMFDLFSNSYLVIAEK